MRESGRKKESTVEGTRQIPRLHHRAQTTMSGRLLKARPVFRAIRGTPTSSFGRSIAVKLEGSASYLVRRRMIRSTAEIRPVPEE